MTEIISIKAREIIDSRGNPTVEVDVALSCGAKGRADARTEPVGRVGTGMASRGPMSPG